MSLIHLSKTLTTAVNRLDFAPPVTHVYSPLEYAAKSHEMYLTRYGNGPKEAIFVGMNPGPFGMAQTGVPFGEVGMVRDWMGIEAKVSRPKPEHPKRPIAGFACTRSEVSGARLWGWGRDRYVTPDAFFARFFVWNYCPLCFMEESGRNFTPDKLPASERAPLFEACDEALRQLVDTLQPQYVIGVGKFAEDRIRAALQPDAARIGRILHPSPASPAANKDWPGQAEKELKALGIKL